MPGRDGTGPLGQGAGTGRTAGPCRRSDSGFVGLILQLIINNWKPILAFLVTALVPVIGRKISIGSSQNNAKIPLLTVKVLKKD